MGPGLWIHFGSRRPGTTSRLMRRACGSSYPSTNPPLIARS
jgi:hypothetical protein